MYIIKWKPPRSFRQLDVASQPFIVGLSTEYMTNIPWSLTFLSYFSCSNISYEIHSLIKTKLCPPYQLERFPLSRLPLNSGRFLLSRLPLNSGISSSSFFHWRIFRVFQPFHQIYHHPHHAYHINEHLHHIEECVPAKLR